MKIAIDARLYGLENAGLGRYVMNLVDQLSALDNNNDYVIFLRKKYFSSLTLPNNWKKVLTDFRHYGIFEQVVFPFYIYREKPDITHFPHFNVPIFYFGRYLVTIHDLLMHTFKGKETTTRGTLGYLVKRIGYRFVIKCAVKRALKIIVPSEVVKKEISDYYHIHKKDIVVTYEGVDEDILETKANGKNVLNKLGIIKPYLIYVGNAYPHKNLDGAIKAVRTLNERENANLKLIIVSSRDFFVKKLKQRIRGHKDFNFVKVLSLVSDEVLGTLLKNSLAFIYPSLSEGFGLQGLESMASGTLVLASDIPTFREIYDKSVIYFDPYDNESMVKAISESIDMDKSKRDIIVKNGKEFVKKYSWTKMAKETLVLYEESSHSI